MRMTAPFAAYRAAILEQTEGGTTIKFYNFDHELYARQFATAKSANIHKIEQITKGYANHCKHGVYRGFHFKYIYNHRMWEVYKQDENSTISYGKFRSANNALDYIDELLDVVEKGLSIHNRIRYDAFQSQNWHDPECPPLNS